MENVRVFWAHAQLLNMRVTTSRWEGKNKTQEQKKRSGTGPSRRPVCSEGPLMALTPPSGAPRLEESRGLHRTFSRLNIGLNTLLQVSTKVHGIRKKHIYNKKEERHLETSDTGHALQATQCAHALYQVGAA